MAAAEVALLVEGVVGGALIGVPVAGIEAVEVVGMGMGCCWLQNGTGTALLLNTHTHTHTYNYAQTHQMLYVLCMFHFAVGVAFQHYEYVCVGLLCTLLHLLCIRCNQSHFPIQWLSFNFNSLPVNASQMFPFGAHHPLEWQLASAPAVGC